ncbi:haloacid dehalogenase [Bombiscardovia apis]|uniref:Haloacid dehalogenase n=1 Tax=Bombiscardovia apis TaxID=2932182 RepID=A0ABM8BDX4_9BIFI|nr:HAD-IA family hydrolase [Bombiscardovia apis]BDR55097.1 haloacid dehalogenase [Bombiscardovia apis]
MENKHNEVHDVMFDFGGVLVDWDPRPCLAENYSQDAIDRFLNFEEPWGFWRCNLLSNAGWGQEKIIEDYASTHDSEQSEMLRTYFDNYRLALKSMMPGMGDVLTELSEQGIGVWGLTNFTLPYVEAIKDKFAPVRLLQDILISAEEYLYKPDPLIYQLALHRFNLDPATTAFVDNELPNVEAANREGIIGVAYTDTDLLRSDLRELGLKL